MSLGITERGGPIFLTVPLPLAGRADFAGASSSLEESPLSLEPLGGSIWVCAMDEMRMRRGNSSQPFDSSPMQEVLPGKFSWKGWT